MTATASRDELIMEYLPAAETIARAYGRKMRHDAATIDDHVQNATLELIRAVDRLSPDFDQPIGHYLRSCISAKVPTEYLRSLSADAMIEGGPVSLSGGKPGRAQSPGDIDLPATPDLFACEVDRSEQREELIAAIGKLRDRLSQNIVLMRHGWHPIYWGQRLAFRKIGIALGISSRVARSDYLHAVAELRGLIPFPPCRAPGE